MRYFFYFLILLISASCVSTKYSVYTNQENFDNIQAGTRYTVYDKSDRKFFVDVTSVEKDSIIGTRKNQRIAIAKKDIKEIDKNKTGATVILIGGTVGLLVTAYIIADTMRALGEGFGRVIGGQ
ncbi:hypothetical protein QGN23_11065 [Chryseobacterium gotjawalense]|uniref:Uncharacterized protein n=1 Tax=Chryseobacterium gotjawalense TaxID=3042315 RepID=A0ABY8RCN3_9FLAO|nr:hypothetical protein [Chryseobacterium sp. wdc7]WHF50967.1 hypothetical protein QGN23_11065 [Chryseobacterium sp. wdc7]